MRRLLEESRRRMLLPAAIGLGGLCLFPAGCLHLHGKHKASQEAAETPCATGIPQIQRRFFVASQGRLGINAEAGSFARELSAAINATPNCTAVLLPLDCPILAHPSTGPGFSPQLMHCVEMAGPSPAVDELLIVAVTDVVAFRPMRIGAILERRSLADGAVIWHDQRTWNAPLDMDPISPNPINRMILNRPPPLGVVEKHELDRLSPQTFQRSVVEKLAAELAASPL